jgi:hypothetical protein
MIKKFLLSFCLFVSAINAEELITKPQAKESFASFKDGSFSIEWLGKDCH